MADTVAVTKVIEIDVKASANAAQHLKDIANGVKGVEENASKASSMLKDLSGWVKGFVGFQIFSMIGDKVLGMASALQEASDRSKILEERMKLVTGSTEEAGRAFSAIIEISIRQGRELDGVAKLYEKVQRNSEQLALTQKGVAMITEGVAASLRLSGASTQEANAAMLQFAQALASGRLGGDEFRSLMENNSVLMQEFAKSLGTTMGGLREMSKEGKLTAGTLRDAMLRIGDDGTNMMQRIMIQTAKLPQTFSQAVTGAKTALVDLINALQQTGDKTEGIFTRMVRAITRAMGEAAQMIRENARVTAAIAEETAKRRTGREAEKEPELTMQEKEVNRLIARKKLAQEELTRAETALARSGLGKADKDYERLAYNVDHAKGSLRAYSEMLEDVTRKNVSSANPLLGLTTGPVPKGVGEDKKGPKVTTAADVIKRIREDLEGEGAKLAALMDGETKVRSALEEKLLEIDRVAPGGMSKKAIEAFKEQARRQVAEQDELRAELDRRKQEAADSEQRLIESNKEVEKKWNEHRRAIEQIRQSMGKKAEKENPFSGIEFEIEQMKKRMWDPATTDEEAQMIADAIQERMHTAGLKVAKDLMGEKEPLLSIGDIMAKNFESAFERMEFDLLDFSKSAKEIVGDLVLSLLQDFARLQLKENLSPLMKMGTEFIKGFDWASLFGAANGAVFGQGGRRLFGMGGVVDQPTNFSYDGGRSAGQMGEAGTEAVMPLQRDSSGRLGVAAAPVNVIVNNFGSGSKVTKQEQTNSKGERDIIVTIEDVIESSMGAGRFDSVMGKSYGITRRGN